VAFVGSDVTLTGTVHTWAQRDLATDAAWGTSGVHSVVNKVNVVYA
jgi:osmotically-inducible protein OsmY